MANRLISEASPYLQQHAGNPVEWWPWSDAALAEAASRGVPILLSIGYSACHWCHVMAHESFEDQATAAYMNEHFVCIKVDREERPDIDAIYLEAAQAMSGHGGWPLTAFLAPDQVPFFAGTYFPPTPRQGMPSFMQLMQSITEVWTQNRAAIDERSKLLVEQLATMSRLQAPEDPIGPEPLELAAGALKGAYDARLGGFGGAPKFPPHSVLEFLLGRSEASERELALETLRKIAAGGIQDQLAGGFSRYSVDDRWHIPHFEKMLYDNALLARAYLHAFLITGEKDFADTARRTLDWMLVDLHDPGAGFASALDADSLDAAGELEEGAFYAWEADEIRATLQSALPEHAAQLLRYWGVIDDGEFEGKNVLFISDSQARPSEEVLAAARAELLALRATRARPAQDHKRITAWNALTIEAFADGARVLGEQRYLEVAVETADFIERELTLGDGSLLRSRTSDQAGPPGYLEDHAYCAAAYLTLYERSGDERWFARARELGDSLLARFEDAELGGFFTVASEHDTLIVRRKDIEDNPIPSGNSAAALALLRLAALTGEDRYRSSAERALRAVQRIAARMPLGFGHALSALAFELGPIQEIALVGRPAERAALERIVFAEHRPRTVVALSADAEDSAVPLLAGRSAGQGALAYVCENFSCELPVATPGELAALLARR